MLNKIMEKGKITFAKKIVRFYRIVVICSILLINAVQHAFCATRDSLEMPRLVVGIVVDQMRQEYLFRFYNKFSQGGFKRLMNGGFMLRNAHYNYIPTKTGPGHASIFTGTTPATHGIVGNEWYSRELHRTVNCVEDTLVQAVGGSAQAGHVSARNLLSTTVTDQLKLALQSRGKVIGLSVKDRGAVLPAGHMADAAYWFDTNSGHFMSSTFYMSHLPNWVSDFNAKRLADQYLNQTWDTLLPIESYTESGPDDNIYENLIGGKSTPVFPYKLTQMRQEKDNKELLLVTPFGNTLLVDFAETAIQSEKLGQDGATDFLTLSFSSTDFIGHNFGPNSKEIEDTYLRLDRDLERFFTYLDQHIGKGNYLLFLTADHAVVDVPKFLEDAKMPGGYINTSKMISDLKQALNHQYGHGEWLENASNEIFLNHQLIHAKGLHIHDIQRFAADQLLTQNGISESCTAADLYHNEYVDGRRALLQAGYHAKRSGDVFYITESGYLTGTMKTGANHGSGYTYDTHVPALFYGWGVGAGESFKYHEITDIAATISMLLHIELTSGASGKPILELLEK